MTAKIKTFYPFLKGINRLTKHSTSTISNLDSRKILEKYEFDEGGFVEQIMITVSDPDVDIKVRYDNNYFEWNPQQLQDYGITEPNSTGLYLSQFDAVNNNYTIIFAPEDFLGFSRKVFLETFNGSDYDVKQYEIIIYEVRNKKQFLESLRELEFESKVFKELTQSILRLRR